MDSKLNLSKYYDEYDKNICPNWLFSKLEKAYTQIDNVRMKKGRLIFAGNGASAAIASHAALDFTKQAKIQSLAFHDAALITAYANDYENHTWLREIFKSYVEKNDLVIFISVSGESPNIVKAASHLNENNIKTICFTGKSENNSLSKICGINFWVDSSAYNIVEGIHMIWVTTLIDMFIGKSEYSVSPKK